MLKELEWLLRQISTSFLHLVYPPLCLHCRESLDADLCLFCHHCLNLLEMIDPKNRCPYCFTSEINMEIEACCSECRHQMQVIHRVASVFDYDGPAATLIKSLKYGGQSYLTESAGAFLVAQFVHLEWPIPDFLIPVPMAPLRKLDRGYNQSKLLAEVVGRLLDRPVLDILQRTAGDFSQAGLSHHQRLQLDKRAITARSTEILQDKCVLLIDDVMTTGSTLKRCGDALLKLHPDTIYALAVCRAI